MSIMWMKMVKKGQILALTKVSLATIVPPRLQHCRCSKGMDRVCSVVGGCHMFCNSLFLTFAATTAKTCGGGLYLFGCVALDFWLSS